MNRSYLVIKSLYTSEKDKSFLKEDNITSIPPFFGLFFSGSWSPQSSGITKTIFAFYKSVNQKTLQFEVFFLTSDIDKTSYDNYSKNIPWLLFPYNSLNISKLESEFDVCNIPRLIVLSSDGKVIRNNGYKEILNFGVEALEKWKTQTDKNKLFEEVKQTGKKVSLHCHEHKLIFCDNEDKCEIKSGWNCNECGQYFDEKVKSFYCFECNYDCCKECFLMNIEL